MKIKKNSTGVYELVETKHKKSDNHFLLTHSEKEWLCKYLMKLVEHGKYDYDVEGRFSATDKTQKFLDEFSVDLADQLIYDLLVTACLSKVEDYRFHGNYDDSEWAFVVVFTNGIYYAKYGICKDGSAIIDIHLSDSL